MKIINLICLVVLVLCSTIATSEIVQHYNDQLDEDTIRFAYEMCAANPDNIIEDGSISTCTDTRIANSNRFK